MSYLENESLCGLRVVKYIRCSHEGQVLHGDTLETQHAILDDYIARNHLVLVDTFVDEALTARKKFTKRKEFVRLLDGVKRHDFDLILFTKLDRWFRNIADYHRIQEILDANNVQWKAVTESYDTTTTNGRLHINIRLSVAQDECDRDSDRIKDVFAFKLKNKTYLSGSLPRGLKLDAEKHVIIDDDWKEYALDMFQHYESTCSIRATLLYLRKKYNVTYGYCAVKNALKNPIYKGEYRDIQDFCPSLIEPERFDHIQQLLYHNAHLHDGPYRSYIFSGLLICPFCHNHLYGANTSKVLASGVKKDYHYYKCYNTYKIPPCECKQHFLEPRIEEQMLSQVRAALSDYVTSYEVDSNQSSIEKNHAAEVAKIQKRLKKLYELYIDDLIDKEAYRTEYLELQDALSKIEAAPKPPQKDFSKLKELLSQDYESVYQTFSPSEKNVFWKSFVQSVVVYDSYRLDITFL